jgi:hypothetical protein
MPIKHPSLGANMRQISKVCGVVVLALSSYFFTQAHAAAPSFRTLETKAIGFSFGDSGSKYAGGLAGSWDFGGKFFVASSTTFGDRSFGGGNYALGLGVFKHTGESTAVFASIGGQQYAFFDAIAGRSDRYTSPNLTVGVKSLFGDRAELEFGISKLTNGPYGATAGLKGTYYFVDQMGVVVEFGSSDGDGNGGIGLRWSF